MLYIDPAERLLGASTVAVLKALRPHSDGLTAVGLASITRLSRADRIHALGRLIGFGIVEHRAAGSTSVYRLRNDHTAWDSVDRLLSARDEAVHAIRAAITDEAGVVSVAVLPSPDEPPRSNPIIQILLVHRHIKAEESLNTLLGIRAAIMAHAGVLSNTDAVDPGTFEELVRADDPSIRHWADGYTIYGRDLVGWIEELDRAERS